MKPLSILLLIISWSAINLNAQVILFPNDNLQEKVDAQPAGTTFIIRGTHRLQTITARDGDTFLGELGPNGERLSVMKGSKIISGWQSASDANGTYWFISGEIGRNNPSAHGTCLAGFDCHRAEDIFENGIPLIKVTSLAAVNQSTKCFMGGDTVFIRHNPAGKTYEASVNKYAINAAQATAGSGQYGSSNVTVKHLIVEQYANPAQHGAVHAGFTNQSEIVERSGRNWLVENVEARYNHGAGIYVNANGQMLNNVVHWNGQIGLKAVGTNILVEGNEIFENGNWGGYNWGWEGGGTKFSLTNDIVIRNNHSYDNKGPGLWTDIDNFGSLYENNLVENNSGPGIFHEISDSAIIRCNTLRYNYNENAGGTFYGGNIFISNSKNVDIYHNYTLSGSTIRDNGIILICATRSSPKTGLAQYLENNLVYENDINFSAGIGRTGMHTTSSCNQASNNVFRDNYYHAVDLNFNHFVNGVPPLTLPVIQASGHEAGSTISGYQSGTPPISFPACSGLQPPAKVNVCKANAVPVIDGQEDCSWKDLAEQPIENLLVGSTVSTADISGFFKVKWNASSLFLYVEVTDDLLVNDTPGATPWNNDGIELFLDGNNAKGTTYDANDHQLIFTVNDNTVFHHSNSAINPTGVNFAQSLIPGGYSMEIQVDWSFVGITPTDGAPIGFDLHLNDDDDGGIRDSKLTFTPLTEDRSFTDPSLFGIAIMESTACTNNSLTLDITVLLEGAYDQASGQMLSTLNATRSLLPGMNGNGISGQPYNLPPWNYQGQEGIDWTAANYPVDAVDWVLVSLRSGTTAATEVVQLAALVHADGHLSFPEACLLDNLSDNAYFIVVEHRNHVGVMSPAKVPIINRMLQWDFTSKDSYNIGASGQKELTQGVWSMFAGDADQITDVVSYDINGSDKNLWTIDNGKFDIYLNTDFNLDGDVNGADRLLWEFNNGVFSSVPK